MFLDPRLLHTEPYIDALGILLVCPIKAQAIRVIGVLDIDFCRRKPCQARFHALGVGVGQERYLADSEGGRVDAHDPVLIGIRLTDLTHGRQFGCRLFCLVAHLVEVLAHLR